MEERGTIPSLSGIASTRSEERGKSARDGQTVCVSMDGGEQAMHSDIYDQL